jgi:hypothetical protein
VRRRARDDEQGDPREGRENEREQREMSAPV